MTTEKYSRLAKLRLDRDAAAASGDHATALRLNAEIHDLKQALQGEAQKEPR